VCIGGHSSWDVDPKISVLLGARRQHAQVYHDEHVGCGENHEEARQTELAAVAVGNGEAQNTQGVRDECISRIREAGVEGDVLVSTM